MMNMLKPLHYLILGLCLALNVRAASAEVVPVVSAQSNIVALSEEEIVQIFLGHRSRLPNGEQAMPIDQAEDSPARAAFYTRFAGMSPAQLKAHWSKIIFTGRGRPPIAVADGVEVKKRVAQKANAIGYIDESLVDDSVRVLRVK